MIVLDASAAMEFLLDTPLGKQVAKAIKGHEASLHAPHLIDLEITQTLRKGLLANRLSRSEAEAALAEWRNFTITRHPHIQFLGPIWRHRNNLAAYDAAYVALAEALGAALVTCDRKQNRAPEVDVQIEVIQ